MLPEKVAVRVTEPPEATAGVLMETTPVAVARVSISITDWMGCQPVPAGAADGRPPLVELPQTVILPSAFWAAKAVAVAKMRV